MDSACFAQSVNVDDVEKTQGFRVQHFWFNASQANQSNTQISLKIEFCFETKIDQKTCTKSANFTKSFVQKNEENC